MSVLRTLLASLLILVAGVGTLALATDGFRAFTSETARRIAVREHPHAVPAYLPMQTAQGTRIDFATLRGRWLLVDFIYTRCTSYCSVQGSQFARLQERLAPRIARGKVMLLSISFDPARDDPASLGAYQRRSGDRGTGWIAARPVRPADLAPLMHAFGVRAIPDGLGGYVHNAAIAVVDPQGKLIAITDWNSPREAAQFVARESSP